MAWAGLSAGFTVLSAALADLSAASALLSAGLVNLSAALALLSAGCYFFIGLGLFISRLVLFQSLGLVYQQV